MEPHYPVNVGHVARLLKNFGVAKLYLVKPSVDMSVASVYASHATEVLDGAELVTFEQVRKRNEPLVATTAVRASKKLNAIRMTTTPELLRDLLLSSKSSSLIFGRDTTGLTNEEITACDVTVSIDVGTPHRSLNLGHAVAIMLYAASRGTGTKNRIQNREARELFAKSFYDLSVASKVRPHKLKSLQEVSKRIAAKSRLSDRELNLMSGTFSKALAAIEAGQERDSKT